MSIAKIVNNQKLEKILINLINALRINILMVDIHGKALLVPKTMGFGFYASSQWGILQDIGKPDFLSKFKIDGNYSKAIDQFGFQNFAIPVAGENLNIIAYLIVGPVILNKHLEQAQYQTITKELNISATEFQESLNEIRVLSFNSLKTILDLLFELSQYAVRIKQVEKPQPQITHSIFTNILELSMNIAQAECGSIMLLNNITNELSILASKGIDPKKLQLSPMKLGEGLAGLAVQQRESFVVKENDNNRISHLLKNPDLKCSLVMPIIKKNNEVLGVMNISTREGKSRLATHSQEMLKNLVDITTGTFNNFL